MLAQNFKTAEELGLTEPQLDALRKTLVLLETGKLTHVRKWKADKRGRFFSGHFNMDSWCWEGNCGTVACIGGTAELIGGVSFCEGDNVPPNLRKLFYPGDIVGDWGSITPAQAAIALRSYLTTGSANWSEALASRVHDGSTLER